MQLDLHMHTTCSDGQFDPQTLLQMCAARGLALVSITDHDTFEAFFKIKKDRAALPAGLVYVPGAELSVQSDVDGKKHHLLVYFPEFALTSEKSVRIGPCTVSFPEARLSGPRFEQFAQFAAKMQEMNKSRVERAKTVFQKLNQHFNLSLDFQEFAADNKINLQNFTAENSIGRPAIAAFLIKKGLIKTVHDAFAPGSYLGDDSPAYEPLPKSSLEKMIQEATALGAKCFLAHAGLWQYPPQSLIQQIKSALVAGLVGTEKYHSEGVYDFETEIGNLPVSRGSDFHGPKVKEDVVLGNVKGEMTDAELETLLKALGAKVEK